MIRGAAMSETEGRIIGVMMDQGQHQVMIMKRMIQNPFGLGIFLKSQEGIEFSKDPEMNYYSAPIDSINFG